MRVFQCDSCGLAIKEEGVIVAWEYGQNGITVQPQKNSRTDLRSHQHYCSIACLTDRLAAKFVPAGILDKRGNGE